MKKSTAIRHILEVCDLMRHLVNWQIVAKCVIYSLFWDSRISEALFNELTDMIENRKLLDEGPTHHILTGRWN